MEKQAEHGALRCLAWLTSRVKAWPHHSHDLTAATRSEPESCAKPYIYIYCSAQPDVIPGVHYMLQHHQLRLRFYTQAQRRGGLPKGKGKSTCLSTSTCHVTQQCPCPQLPRPGTDTLVAGFSCKDISRLTSRLQCQHPPRHPELHGEHTAGGTTQIGHPGECAER